jgi:serine/threonine protein phosphatase PrpC
VVHAATQAGTRSTTRPNQDAFGVALGVCNPGVLLATLLDGHGPDGHFISRHVRDRLPAWAASCEPPADDSASPPSPVVVIPPGFQPPPAWQSRCARAMALDASGSLSRASASGPRWASALPAAFLLLDNDLCSGRSSLLQASRATPEHSGCACVCAMLGEGHLAVAGCGDSAAFLAQRRPDGGFAVLPLSVVHKPLGDEAQRIRLAGGRVAAHPAERHVPRVWPPDSSAGAQPYALAVSRAFGDRHWKAAGVCASPDVVHRTLQPGDAFVLLCSDGVTDVMSGQAAVDVAAALRRGERGESGVNAALAVNEEAKRLWAAIFPKSALDDISTMIIVCEVRPPPRNGEEAPSEESVHAEENHTEESVTVLA